MRVLFFGSSEFAIPTFRSILNDGHQIVAAVTMPDKVRGRGSRTTPTPVKKLALESGVPVLTPDDVNAPDCIERINSLGADVGYVAAYGRKFGPQLLGAFPAGMINLHASRLPALRGAGPIQRAIINGLDETGVTVFRLVDKMDAGPILSMRRTAIGPDETADELHDRLAGIGCDAVRPVLGRLATEPDWPGEPQDESAATYAPKLKKTDGLIRFDASADRLACRIRGLWSWPGASCRFVSADGARDEIVILARAVPYEGRSAPIEDSDQLGRITEVLSVRTADGDLAILELKPANGKRMSWQDFVNGRRVVPGDRFVSIESP